MKGGDIAMFRVDSEQIILPIPVVIADLKLPVSLVTGQTRLRLRQKAFETTQTIENLNLCCLLFAKFVDCIEIRYAVLVVVSERKRPVFICWTKCRPGVENERAKLAFAIEYMNLT